MRDAKGSMGMSVDVSVGVASADEPPLTIDAALLAAERPRLLRVCLRLCGDAAVAEDLVQETLVEAWRHARHLRQPDAYRAWLSGIARHVYLRWLRAHGRERARRQRLPDATDDPLLGQIADPDDITLDLERDDLATLLDRALALLPEATSAALVHHYVHELPQAEVAQLLGMSTGAVAMRLSRGRLALRRVLATDLQAEAAAFGLGVMDAAWAPTRIWCPQCGQARLVGRRDAAGADAAGSFQLRCPSCFPAYGLYEMRALAAPPMAGTVATWRRVLRECGVYYAAALRTGVAKCPTCGGAVTVHTRLPAAELPRRREAHGAHVHCQQCDAAFHVSLSGLVLGHPAAQAFRARHQRIRIAPEQPATCAGRAAWRTRLESVGSSDTLEMLTDRDRLLPLRVLANGHDITASEASSCVV